MANSYLKTMNPDEFGFMLTRDLYENYLLRWATQQVDGVSD